MLRTAASLANPWCAGLVALIIYLVRASLSPTGLAVTEVAYFNYLADAFLRGQLHLRLVPPITLDLVFFGDRLYLYWPPFPAVAVMPLVAFFGHHVSDVLYTAVFAALCVALVATLLELLDRIGIAPLTAERRALLVANIAFGSVLLILAPVGRVWFTSQVLGWGCVLLATVAALGRRDRSGYLIAGVALACATATRTSLLFNGVWLLYYLWQRDRRQPVNWRLGAAAAALGPMVVGLALLGVYNWARFGNPLDMGIAWHQMSEGFRADYERYGMFNLYYLPKNLYYQFIAHPFLDLSQFGMGGSLFLMTPVLFGALYAVWRERRRPIVWALVLSCILIYIPIGLLMGTGFFTFGPRYLLDLMVPVIILTAMGIRNWPLVGLQAMTVIGIVTYVSGSIMWLRAAY